nr:hypothetical protein [Lysobacter enzymogenes]
MIAADARLVPAAPAQRVALLAWLAAYLAAARAALTRRAQCARGVGQARCMQRSNSSLHMRRSGAEAASARH